MHQKRESGDQAHPAQWGRTEPQGKHSCKQWEVQAGGAWHVKKMGTNARWQSRQVMASGRSSQAG